MYRSYMMVNAGFLAGIFGMSGLYGFIFYIIMFYIASFVIGIKTNFKTD